MILREYNRRVMAGEAMPEMARCIARIKAPADQPLAATCRFRGDRRVVTCPYCDGEHEHDALDLGKTKAAPCCDLLYFIVTSGNAESKNPIPREGGCRDG